jgi:hypothetical protein
MEHVLESLAIRLSARLSHDEPLNSWMPCSRVTYILAHVCYLNLAVSFRHHACVMPGKQVRPGTPRGHKHHQMHQVL